MFYFFQFNIDFLKSVEIIEVEFTSLNEVLKDVNKKIDFVKLNILYIYVPENIRTEFL